MDATVQLNAALTGRLSIHRELAPSPIQMKFPAVVRMGLLAFVIGCFKGPYH